ncbi:MAG: serine/threonine-protein kinase [Rhodothermales bacterium]
MTPERWQQINALLDAVLELPPGEQEAYLDVHCKDDRALRREVLSLLEAHDEAHSFLEKPAQDYAATLIQMPNELAQDALVGKNVDGYHILDVIGRGGMGVVYRAEDEALSRTVALKMIDPALARDATFVRRFRSEARALARIDSPHIVRVHAMRQTQAGLFIVMEYVDGGTVTDLLQKGAVSWQRALPIIRQMLTALEHAHSVGVIHRDIKPSNIMLTRKGVVKVTDFGLAKVHQKDGMATVTQGIAGTLYYMSPEQVKALPTLDHRSDLFSMGMTIYQMLAGRLPLDRDAKEFTVMRSIVEDVLPPPSTFKRSLPKAIDQVVMQALEKEPARRYQSAAQMRSAFEALQQGEEDDTVIEGDPYTPPDPSRRKYLLMGAAAMLVVALAVVGYLLWPFGGGARPALLSLTTTPDNARVFLNDRPIRNTPITHFELDDAGEPIRLRIEKAGYVTVDTTIQVAAADSLVLNIPLVPVRIEAPVVATLLITSNPGNAHVQINSNDAGETDERGRLSGVEVDTGAVLVEISKEGYKLWRETYHVGAGETLPIPAALEPEDDGPDPDPPTTATLTLRAVPNGTVSVGNQTRQGQGRFTVTAARAHAITFHHPTYGEGCRRNVTLQSNQTGRYTCYFEHKVVVQVRREDGTPIWASILINGNEVDGSSDKEFIWGPGTYTIAIKKFGYDVLTDEQTVTIEPAFEEKRQRVEFQIRQQ